MLIAINPFKDTQIYGRDVITSYRHRTASSPHVYVVADTAYNEMMRGRLCHSCCSFWPPFGISFHLCLVKFSTGLFLIHVLLFSLLLFWPCRWSKSVNHHKVCRRYFLTIDLSSVSSWIYVKPLKRSLKIICLAVAKVEQERLRQPKLRCNIWPLLEVAILLE